MGGSSAGQAVAAAASPAPEQALGARGEQPWRHERGVASPLPAVDLGAFAADVQALRRQLIADIGAADLDHLRKMERWGRACTLAGYATAWLAPNPLSALLMALGNTARWTMTTHHVMHRGYDRVPAVPARYHSQHYARGWRRWLDWQDWLYPPAWAHEHNQLHHGQTGELGDPDLVEHHAWLTRRPWLPRLLKWLLLVLLMATWKLSYYAPNTYWAWQHRRRRADSVVDTATAAATASGSPGVATVWRLLYPGERLWRPWSPASWAFYRDCLLPYALWRFGVLPALFLPLGTAAWAAVLVNSLLAEVLANLHSFLVIAPNHSGEDLYRFDRPAASRAEASLRQVLGSTNYPGGSDARDFFYGYLNYQIEHHLWPDLPMLKYRQAAPALKAICARHGVPYVEQGVWRRFGKLWAILTGAASMRRAESVERCSEPGAHAETEAAAGQRRHLLQQ